MEAHNGNPFWGKMEEKGENIMKPFWTEESIEKAERDELQAVRERLLELGYDKCEIVPIYVLDDAIEDIISRSLADISNVIYFAKSQNVSKMIVTRLPRAPLINIFVEQEKKDLLLGKRKRGAIPGKKYM